MRNEGKIAAEGLAIDALRPVRFTTEETSRAVRYAAGQTVVFHRAYRRLGVARGETFEVVRVDGAEGVVTLRRQDGGRSINWAPHEVAGRTTGAVEVFETRRIDIAAGDAVRFTRNDPEKRFLNGDRGRIVEAGRAVVVALGVGRALILAASDKGLAALDYDYANTVHAYQGRTVDRLIAAMDSRNANLTHQKSFYVALSRASHGVDILTDDRAQLQTTIAAETGEKIAALDLVQTLRAAGKTTVPDVPARDHVRAPANPQIPPSRAYLIGERADRDFAQNRAAERSSIEAASKANSRSTARDADAARTGVERPPIAAQDPTATRSEAMRNLALALQRAREKREEKNARQRQNEVNDRAQRGRPKALPDAQERRRNRDRDAQEKSSDARAKSEAQERLQDALKQERSRGFDLSR